MGGLQTRDKNHLLGSAVTAANVLFYLSILRESKFSDQLGAEAPYLLDILERSATMLGLTSTVSSLARGLVGWHGRESLIITNSFIALQMFVRPSGANLNDLSRGARAFLTVSALSSVAYLSFQAWQERNDHPLEIEHQFDELDITTYRNSVTSSSS